MVDETQILEKLANAVMNCNAEEAAAAAREAIEAGIDPLKAIHEGLGKGIKIIGDKFERSEVFLPHVVMAADAMMAGVKVLEPKISPEKMKSVNLGTIVIGTVKGDIHDIGKNIVAIMLRAAGFEVHDLGVDVPSRTFVEKAEQVKADIIAMSGLLTMSLPEMKDVIQELERKGLRQKYKVVVGGGPVTRQWAQEIGAEGYGVDAVEAVAVCKKILGKA
jgi:corrinoid protein of di/trimethylamine methyltransferase